MFARSCTYTQQRQQQGLKRIIIITIISAIKQHTRTHTHTHTQNSQQQKDKINVFRRKRLERYTNYRFKLSYKTVAIEQQDMFKTS